MSSKKGETFNLPDIREKNLSDFWSFYNPPISNDVKSLWLKNADSNYAFYRAFVPLFYRILSGASDINIQNIKQLKDHKGWIVGDPHPANFGAILTKDLCLKHSIIYTVNDSDDGFGNSPLYVDFLRFLTGIQIIGNDCFPVNKIRKFYLQGLKGEYLVKQPREIRECLKKFWKNEKQLKKRDYKRFFEERKHKVNSPIIEMSSQKLSTLEKILKSEWHDNKLKIDQGFEYVRAKGGSGGLARNVLLVKFSKRKQPIRISRTKWLVVELKGMRQPSIQYASSLLAEEIKDAQEQTMKWQSRNKLSILYRIIKDGQPTNSDNTMSDREGQYWTMRPRWVENPVVDPNEVEQYKLRKKIYLYQANVLGNLHRIKAENPCAYHEDLTRISTKIWKKAAKYMAFELENIRKSNIEK